jgi:hypothetical protein
MRQKLASRMGVGKSNGEKISVPGKRHPMRIWRGVSPVEKAKSLGREVGKPPTESRRHGVAHKKGLGVILPGGLVPICIIRKPRRSELGVNRDFWPAISVTNF